MAILKPVRLESDQLLVMVLTGPQMWCRMATLLMNSGPFANSWDCGLAGWWWGSC